MSSLARNLALITFVFLYAPAAFALPMLSVSNPTSVGVGTSFSVDILISGVDAGTPLNAFEFDLDFDASVITATSVVDGGFMLDPVFVIQQNISAISVEFAEVTLLPDGAIGSGVLATIEFDAILEGISALDLSNVLLSAPFGVQIATGGVTDGSVTVTSPLTSPVPEPSGLLLSAIGFSIVAASVRRKHC